MKAPLDGVHGTDFPREGTALVAKGKYLAKAE